MQLATDTDEQVTRPQDAGLERLWTVAELAKDEGVDVSVIYAGINKRGWPHRTGLGPTKFSLADRIQIREMCRQVKPPVVEKPKRMQAPRRRRSTPSRAAA